MMGKCLSLDYWGYEYQTSEEIVSATRRSAAGHRERRSMGVDMWTYLVYYNSVSHSLEYLLCARHLLSASHNSTM